MIYGSSPYIIIPCPVNTSIHLVNMSIKIPYNAVYSFLSHSLTRCPTLAADEKCLWNARLFPIVSITPSASGGSDSAWKQQRLSSIWIQHLNQSTVDLTQDTSFQSAIVSWRQSHRISLSELLQAIAIPLNPLPFQRPTLPYSNPDPV